MNENKKYYHGTSYERAMSILCQGFGNFDANLENQTIWNCSDSDSTYLVPDCSETDDNGFMFAVTAAQIAAAKSGSSSENLCVFEFEFTNNSELEEDYSAEGMEYCSCVESRVLNFQIKSGATKCTLHILEKAYEPMLQIFYLVQFVRNYNMSFSKEEYEILKLVGENPDVWEYIYENGWKAESTQTIDFSNICIDNVDKGLAEIMDAA